jgi:hypothetical protein
MILQKVYLLRLMPVCVGLIMVSCLCLSVLPTTSGVKLNRAERKAACRLHLITLNQRTVIVVPSKKSWLGSACSIKSCIKQVVFTGVQITILQRVAVLPVLGYWSEFCPYWLTQNRRCL